MPRFCSTMLRFLMVAICGAFAVTPANGQQVDDRIKVDAADWPWWRGPLRNGIANPEQAPPTEWSESQNVVWKAAVPGRGHGSPTVIGNQIFLATADEARDTQSVLCYNRNTGKQLWERQVHGSGGMRKNAKASAASSTVACDGESVFITFANSDAVYATALTRDGKQLWQTRICDYKIHQGYGSSPAVYQSLVIVSADSHLGGAVAALDRRSGAIVWKRERPKLPNYPSPIILHVDGRDQLLLSGCDLFSSFDPLTGKTLWEINASTEECVSSTVTDGKHVFCSGGYPKNHLAAVLADGSGKIAWETNDRVYVPSLLERDGYLYGVLDAGVAACWRSDTGEEMWKARLGGDFSASPVLIGDTIYATNEIAETFVYRADPQKFTQVAMNKLGDQVFATPTICGGRIYLRVAQQVDGKRQEMLYCLGKNTNPKR